MITAGDWRTVGINADTAVWNAQNGFSVAADSFTEEQMMRAIDPDPHFVIVDTDPTPQNRDMTPGEADQAAQNPVDLLGLLNGDDDVSTDESRPPDNGPHGDAE
jgi:hypothetical protein